MATKYNIPEDSVNIIKNFNEVTAGSVNSLFNFLNYFFQSNIQDSNVIKSVKKYIDLKNIFDYTILSFYTSNYDWPFNNIIVWNSRQYDSCWRFICNDFDWSFALDNDVTHPENDCVFRFFTNKDSSGWLFAKIVSKLLENIDLRNKFLNRTADLLNSVFLNKPVKQLIDSMHNLYNDEISRQRDKYPDCMEFRDDSYLDMIDFAERRPEFLRQHLVEQFNLPGTAKLKVSSNLKHIKIRINSILTDLNETFEGIYFKEIPIEIKIVNSDNYEFIGWSRKDLPNETNINLILNDSTELVALFREEDEFQPIVVNEIIYKSSKDKNCKDWFELYNPNNKELVLDGYQFKDDNNSHTYQFPSRTKISPYGYLVVAEKPAEFRNFYPEVINVIGDFSFGLGTNDQIRIYDSFGILVDSVAYHSSPPWPLGADETGYSIELINPALDNNKGENWKTSSVLLGTPGKPNSNLSSVEGYVSSININKYLQIYPNPSKDFITISFDKNYNFNNMFEKDSYIKIYNSLGECIYSKHKNLDNKIDIDVSGFVQGVYFVKYFDFFAIFIKI